MNDPVNPATAAGPRESRRWSIARIIVALAGVGFLASTLTGPWVATVRHLTGYGSATVAVDLGAWTPALQPELLVAAVVMALVAGLAVANAAGPWRGRQPEFGVYAILGLVAGTAIIVALAGLPALADGGPSNSIRATPGPLAAIGLLLTAIPITAGVLRSQGASSAAARRIAWVRPAGIVTAVGVLVAGAVLALPSLTATPPVASEATGPIPDWRTTPDEPYPFTTPVPPLVATDLDGVYARPSTYDFPGTQPLCVRCPPYPADAGTSTWRLEAGRFEVLHETPAYRTSGHFEVSGNRLILFNDTECGNARGVYRWSVASDGALSLSLIVDPCAFGQRWKELAGSAWSLKRSLTGERRGYCDPPNVEAAVTEHWPRPSDC